MDELKKQTQNEWNEEFHNINVLNLSRGLVLNLASNENPHSTLKKILRLPYSKERLQNISAIMVAAHRVTWPIPNLLEAIASEIEPNFSMSDGVALSFGKSDHQLGYETSSNVQNIPKHVQFEQKGIRIRQIAAARYHSLAIDINGNVWSWGIGRNGRLGLGNEITHITPVRVSLPQPAIHAACGKDHSVVACDTGVTYAWGSDKHGQCGFVQQNTREETLSLSPRKVPIQDVCAVSASATHTLALIENGEVYSWGMNDKGQLGRRDGQKPLPITCIQCPSKQVCAADGVSYILSDAGIVFRLGREYAAKIHIVNDDHDPLWCRIQDKKHGGGINVIATSIACGKNHACAIDTEGRVYSWGASAGLLGHAKTGEDREKSHSMVPMRIQSLEGIRHVACGHQHSLAVDHKGNVWSWGNRDFGVSSEHAEYQPSPSKMESLKQVNNVIASDVHSFVTVGARVPEFDFEIDLPQVVPIIYRASTPDSLASDDSDDDNNDGTHNLSPVPETSPRGVPSLQRLCERTLSTTVSLWNVFHMWRLADQYFAYKLAGFCEEFINLNLEAVFSIQMRDMDTLREFCQWEAESLDKLTEQFSVRHDSCEMATPPKKSRKSPSNSSKSKKYSSSRSVSAAEEDEKEEAIVVVETIEATACKLFHTPQPPCAFDNEEENIMESGPVTDDLYCVLCHVRVCDMNAMVEHVAGKRHRKAQQRRKSQEDRTLLQPTSPKLSSKWCDATTIMRSPSSSLQHIIQEEQQAALQKRNSIATKEVDPTWKSPVKSKIPNTTSSLVSPLSQRGGGGDPFVLGDFLKTASNTVTSIPTKAHLPWGTATSRKPSKKLPVRGSPRQESLRDIQAQQELMSNTPKVCPLSSSWGYVSEIVESFEQIQIQQEMEFASEALALKLALEEGSLEAQQWNGGGNPQRRTRKPRQRR